MNEKEKKNEVLNNENIEVKNETDVENKAENSDEKTKEKVKKILEKAKEKGKITYGELASELDDANPSQMEKIFDAMEKMGVNLFGDDFEEGPDEEDLEDVDYDEL